MHFDLLCSMSFQFVFGPVCYGTGLQPYTLDCNTPGPGLGCNQAGHRTRNLGATTSARIVPNHNAHLYNRLDLHHDLSELIYGHKLHPGHVANVKTDLLPGVPGAVTERRGRDHPRCFSFRLRRAVGAVATAVGAAVAGGSCVSIRGGCLPSDPAAASAAISRGGPPRRPRDGLLSSTAGRA